MSERLVPFYFIYFFLRPTHSIVVVVFTPPFFILPAPLPRLPNIRSDSVRLRLPSSAKVAKAAAYVVSETLTVEQFFQRGAAIGIQMKQSPSQGMPGTTPRAWDNSGPVLLDLVSQADVP
jgi:hypothetical protein